MNLGQPYRHLSVIVRVDDKVCWLRKYCDADPFSWRINYGVLDKKQSEADPFSCHDFNCALAVHMLGGRTGVLPMMRLRMYFHCHYSERAASGYSIFVALVLTFATTTLLAATEGAAPIPYMAWEQSFGDEQYSYESKAAVVAPGGILTVVGTYNPVKNRHAPPEGVWIWKIDGGGNKIADVRFKFNILNSTLVGIDACELVGDGVVAMVARLSNGSSSLLYVDASGKVIKTVELGNRRIAKLFRMSDSSLMLTGQKNGNLLLMKLDKLGVIVWEKLTDKGKDDSIIDGIAIADHLLLVEISGKQEQFFITDSVVGLVTPAIDGKIGVPTFATKGRGGSLARNSTRTVLLYDAAMTSEQDMRLVMLDSKHHVIQETPITKGKIALERFRVGLAGKSDFIVAGTVGGKMLLTLIDQVERLSRRILG